MRMVYRLNMTANENICSSYFYIIESSFLRNSTFSDYNSQFYLTLTVIGGFTAFEREKNCIPIRSY